jgi:hypothetical protein
LSGQPVAGKQPNKLRAGSVPNKWVTARSSAFIKVLVNSPRIHKSGAARFANYFRWNVVAVDTVVIKSAFKIVNVVAVDIVVIKPAFKIVNVTAYN